MEEFISLEPGYSDSPSPISEPPDITNWFSSYVYESFQLSSSVKEKPLDIRNWFSSYVYESPVLDTSDGLEYSIPGESERVKETQTEEEATKIDGNDVCPRLSEQELASFAKVSDFSQSQSVLSEPPDVRNWFPSYEYQSPQLTDTHELEFHSSGKDQLIINESDTEEETSCGIFRKTMSKQENVSTSKLSSDDCKENIAADTTNEVSSDNQEMEKKSSVGLFNDSTKEVKQESSLEQEPVFCEPRCSPRISRYNPEPQFPLKNEASLHELRLQHIQETISMSSSRQKSPKKTAQKACLDENLESVDQESDDKENADRKSTETGFVTMKRARFREARDRCSMTKPNRGVLMGCSRGEELKNIAGEEDKEERKKKRRVLGEMSNHQFSGAEEIAGKWHCPQRNKGKSGPPLKQLRLDAWVHKV
ncbi:hypothetical protein EUTSA_v10027153mg [Eutrema salsugineum]|uniref:Uncharacterized protein n=1 Tax=Eutrema salsugineum TaxID=72664 RepID=V4MGR5_EUTSA|nr:hypothetical protein EUTSA_v10027153mg [Eutrema salsugineum]